MAKYQRRLTIDNMGSVTTSSTLSVGPFRTLNSAMRDGKDVLREVGGGSWLIDGRASRPGYLILHSEQDGRKAVIEAIEIDKRTSR